MGMDRGICVVADARVAGVRSDGHIEIACAPAAQCGSCRGSCFMLPTHDGGVVPLPDGGAWSLGDAVRIELPAARLLRAAVIVYGAPLAGLAFGALAGYGVEASDIGCLLGAVTGFASSLWLVARINARLERFVMAGLKVSAP
jgi:positive regulator of sigma E activity